MIAPCPANETVKVLAVIPCLNEIAQIEQVVTALLDDAETLDLRIVIADGGSTDGTAEVAKTLAAAHPHVMFVRNDKKIQAAAVNRAVELYGADCDLLLRVDAHCGYPRNYAAQLVAVQRQTLADSVVVSMTAQGVSCFQRAVAAAQNSRLGNGGSAHRRQGEGRFVDHGHHALMTIAAFKAVSGYDERFTHNEDAELDVRLGSSGFRIWLAGAPSISYFPRKTPLSLFRQYFNYGKGRAKTLIKHKKRPRARQLLPLAIAPAAALGLLSPLEAAFAAPFALWTALCLGYGAAIGFKAKSLCAAFSGVAAMVMHLAWSLGFFAAVIRHWAGKGLPWRGAKLAEAR